MTANVVQNNDFSKQNAEKSQEKILPEVEQITLLWLSNVSYFLTSKNLIVLWQI